MRAKVLDDVKYVAMVFILYVFGERKGRCCVAASRTRRSLGRDNESYVRTIGGGHDTCSIGGGPPGASQTTRAAQPVEAEIPLLMTSSLSLRCPVLGRLSPALLLAWTLCVCLSVAQAAESPPTKKEKTKEQLEVLSQMAMWPQISIRDLLAGEESAPPPSSSGDTPSPPVDLLFVLQAQNLTFLPNTEGGIIGATVKLKGVYETIVSFADRPYRTFDSIPVSEFFAYPLVQDFFRGPNPPNAIVAGELPVDIAQHFARRDGDSDVLPHRRLLGAVLGAASYDANANELEFRLPAGIDIFQADGSTRIVTPEVFEEIEEAYAAAGKGVTPAPDEADRDADTLPVLQQVSLFIDSFERAPPPAASVGSRKLLQHRAVGRRGGRFGGSGRAGAVRVGGGGAVRPSAGRRGFNGGVTNNFIRRGGQNVLIGGAGWGGRGLGWRGGIYGNAVGWGDAGLYGDPYYDPLFGSRAVAYSQPFPRSVPVPVPVPVPSRHERTVGRNRWGTNDTAAHLEICDCPRGPVRAGRQPRRRVGV